MPICKKCNSKFPNHIKIDGIKRNLCRRKFCLECSPFGSHNTRPILDNKILVIPKCNNCGIEGKEHFYERANRSNTYYSYCKNCYNKQSVDRQKNNKEFAVEYKGNKCQICGYNKCISALEFHHIDPQIKDTSIRFSTCSRNKLIEELDKCILVCANCHREIHSNVINLQNFIPV